MPAMALLAWGCQASSPGSPVAGEGSADADTVAAEEVNMPLGLAVETVAEELEVPWDLAFAPDGRILVTERPGRIRLIEGGTLQEDTYAEVEVYHRSEAGLMGIALHPEFDSNGYLYVCYTYREGRDTFNRIARLTDHGDFANNHHAILDRIPGASRHDGCRIRFGPDGYLYATTGDAIKPDLAQDLASLAGKVLRMADDGSVPHDNPFPDSLVFTWGHRNPQGLDWHPETGEPFITEHGPDRDDEINILEAGRNYGWPGVTGVSGDTRYSDPIVALTPTVAIAGAAFISGDRFPLAWRGNLAFAALKGSHLQRVVLDPPHYRSVASRQTLFRDKFGRIRAVVMGPDGFLYFTTSNQDGRGSPQDGDDKLLRLVPAPPR